MALEGDVGCTVEIGRKVDIGWCTAHVRFWGKADIVSHATGVNQPLRFSKRFVAVEAVELHRNQINRFVLACHF